MTTPLYMIDEENVSFQPRNCHEAIVLFNRMKRKKQIQWDYVPELLQKLAADLGPEDHDRFCEWICNPCEIKPGQPGYFAALCADPSSDDEKSPDSAARDTHAASGPSPEDRTIACDNCIDTDSACISAELCTQQAPPQS